MARDIGSYCCTLRAATQRLSTIPTRWLRSRSSLRWRRAMARSGVRVILFAIACLLGCQAGPDRRVEPAPVPRPAIAMRSAIDEAKWRAAIAGVLPRGAIIVATAQGTTPDGWFGEPAALELEGRLDDDKFTIWVLPRDWVGIRTTPTEQVNYWDGILANADATTITTSTESTIPEALRKLQMSTPSLVNSGWFEAKRVWKDRFADADRQAAELIAANARDRSARDAAAYSLVVLGVPAAEVFRTAAVEAAGDAKVFAIDAV